MVLVLVGKCTRNWEFVFWLISCMRIPGTSIRASNSLCSHLPADGVDVF